MSPETITPEKPNNKMNLRIDLRLVIVVLLVALVALVLLWKPWQAAASADARTVSVTGTATVTATPDEFVFTPSYEFKNADKAAALKAVTAKSNEIVPKLKALGVPDSKIRTDSSGYNYGMYSFDDKDSAYTYTLALTITVNDEKLAQKVQDYLVTTSPSGLVSPSASFSKAAQKKLESQARDDATKEARAKADQSAKNLGFTVGKVKSVDDSGFGGGMQPFLAQGSNLEVTSGATDSLKLQPGQNDLDYSVTVVYYVR